MPIDTSIYQQLRPIEMPSPLDSASKAMTLSHLAMQNRQAARAEQEQDAVRSAFAKNVGPNGEINRQGVLSDLAKTSPLQSLQYKSQFAEMDQKQADAQQKVLADKINQMGLAAQMAMSAKDQGSYDAMLGRMKGMGLDVSHMPTQYDPGLMRQYALASLDQKARLEAMTKTSEMDINQAKAPLDRAKTAAEIIHTNAQTGKVLAETSAQKGLTPGQKHADETFAKDAAEYYYGGGKASVEKNFARLEGAIEKLKTVPGLTGGLTTRVPLLGSDMAQDSINPEMAAVRDEIRGAIQGSLRQVLGPQFTEKEGEAIFNRAFNPRLSASENVRRATAELESIRRMADEKDRSMQSFLANGTLKGYSPAGTNLAIRGQIDSPSGSGVPGVNTAQAGGGAPPVQPAIPMIGPNGKMKMVPADQVGEAIASGGRKVVQKVVK